MHPIILQILHFLFKLIMRKFPEVKTETHVDASTPIEDIPDNWHEKYLEFEPPKTDKPSKHSGGKIDPQMMTIHYTASNASIDKMEAYMLSRSDPASYNYLIDNTTGEIRCLVNHGYMSFSDGLAEFLDAFGVWKKWTNKRTISISVCQDGRQEYSDAVYKSIAQIIHFSVRVNPNFKAWAVTGHEFIAPTRRTDPGQLFDWKKLMVHYVGFSEKFWEDYLYDLYQDRKPTIDKPEASRLKLKHVRDAITRLYQDFGHRKNQGAFSYGRNTPEQIRDYVNNNVN